MPTAFSALATIRARRPWGTETWIGFVSEDTGANMGLNAPIILTNTALGEERYVELSELVTSGPIWYGKTWEQNFPVTVRPTTENDAVSAISMSGGPRIPLPVPVLAAIHQSNGEFNMPTLWSMSDDDGFVVTMMLATDVGLYVRFSNQWHLLSNDDVVDGLSVHEVDGAALDMFDQFDRAGQLVHTSAMKNNGHPIDLDALVSSDALPKPVVAAVATEQPELKLQSAEDLPDAIAAAGDDAVLQWWVATRVRALKIEADLPWES